MDAIALNLPLATVANSTAGNPDSGLAALTDARDPRDFAALLSAGLEQLQTNLLAQELTLPPSALQSEPPPAELAGNAIAPSIDVLAALPAALLHAQARPEGNATLAALDEARSAVSRDAVSDQTIMAGTTESKAASAAMFAAAPATDASSTASVQAQRDDPLTRLVADRETLIPQSADVTPVAEAGAQAAHLQAPEQRSFAPQSSALLDVAAPVSSPGFAEDLSRQIVWMVDKDAQVAQLRINPPELGPVEVRLTINGDEAIAQFSSPHLDVRNALEAAVARLRDSMAQAGIQLGEANVSAESFREQASSQSSPHDNRRAYRDEANTGEQNAHTRSASAIVRRGLVDVFA